MESVFRFPGPVAPKIIAFGWFALVCLAGPLPADVHLSEVMYNPPGGDDFEFVEIYNDGPADVALNGWGLTGAIEFAFPGDAVLKAGFHAVVVRSIEAFREAYPAVAEADIAGSFEGRLDNDGERLRLFEGPRLVDEVRYDDDSPWDFLADGFGASLERICFDAPAAMAENWRAGAVPSEEDRAGGSPAAANTTELCPPEFPSRPRVLLSEIHYHAVLEESLEDRYEFVEIHNASEEPVPLKGWRLAGGIDYAFPEDATIAAGDYLVIAKNRVLLGAVPGYDIPAGKLLGDYDRTLDNGGEKVAILGDTGQGIDLVTYDDDFPWPLAADALGASSRWLDPEVLPLEDHVHKGRSLERIRFDRPAGEVENWAPSPLDGMTPGAANASAAGILPTIVADIDVRPASGENRLIHADEEVRLEIRFAPSGFTGTAVLEYFVDDVNERDEERVLVSLADDGQDGDLVGGDRVFSALLPPRDVNTIVRYRILVDRGGGAPPETLSPRPSDPVDWHAYFVSPVLDHKNPTFHLFVSTASLSQLWNNINANPRRVAGCQRRESWNAREWGIFVHDGEVSDVRVRYQGSRYNRGNGPTISRWTGVRPAGNRALSWRISLPRYQQLEGRRELILNKLTQGCPGYNAGVGYRLFEMAGLPAARTQFVRMHLNGQYYRYMIDLERGGEDMMRRYHRDEAELTGERPEPVGFLYKSIGCNCDEGPYGWGDWRILNPSCGYSAAERYAATYDPKTNDWAGNAPFVKLIEDLHVARRSGTAALREYFAENFDLDLLMSYIAIINWSVPFDDMFQNHFVYQRASDGKWLLMPWDLDQNFGGGWGSANMSIYAGEQGDPANRSGWWHYLKDAFLKSHRVEYQDHLLLLNNTILHPDVVSDLVDRVTEESDPDEAARSASGVACSFPGRVTSFKNFARQRFLFVNQQISGVDLDAGPDQIVFAGQTVQFDARASEPDPGPEIEYIWSNGMVGDFPTFRYDEPGMYTVTLSVTARGVTFTDSVQVEVMEIPDRLYLEEGGRVVLEAETFFQNVRRDNEDTWWEEGSSQAGFSGAGYMEAIEANRKTFSSSGHVGVAPELRYGIRFTETGPYRIWVRAFVPEGRRDSVYLSFDGLARTSGFYHRWRELDPTNFVWSGDTNREGPNILEVAEPGFKLFSIWIKESGVVVDKVMMTKDLEEVPEGLGPEPSPLGSAGGTEPFVRGDVNESGRLDVSDAIKIWHHLFLGGPLGCEDAADVDDSGVLDTTDPTLVVRYIFLRGRPPEAPFPNAGFDETADGFPCGDR